MFADSSAMPELKSTFSRAAIAVVSILALTGALRSASAAPSRVPHHRSHQHSKRRSAKCGKNSTTTRSSRNRRQHRSRRTIRCKVQRRKPPLNRKHRRPAVNHAVPSHLLPPSPVQLRPPSPAPVNPYVDRVGISISYAIVNQSVADIQWELTQLRSGGVSWVREDFAWALAEPRRGVFNWTPTDNLMTAASRTGIHVLGILDYSAPWASSDPSGHGDVFFPPKSNADFAAYAAAVTSRYGNSGSFWTAHPDLTRTPLSAMEIWNEPYGSWFWKPGPDPAAYAAMVRATAPVIHAADPKMQIIMSGDLQSWDDGYAAHLQPWLSSVLRADPGVTKLVNGLGVHPYSEPRNLGPDDAGPNPLVTFGRVALIHQAEVASGVSLPIWITEVGWSTAPGTPYGISTQQQASYMAAALRRGIIEWGGFVKRIFLFGWYRSSDLPGDMYHNYGLLFNNGVPKPAWTTITQLLGGLPSLQACPVCPDAT